MNRYRLFISKTENFRFTSHLDFVSAICRAIRRTDLPVAFTEGFNPRIKYSYCLPLPLGYTSECEIMDIFLNSVVEENRILSAAEVKKIINEKLPVGIFITNCEVVDLKSPTLSSKVKTATYIIKIVYNEGLMANIDSKKNDYTSQDAGNRHQATVGNKQLPENRKSLTTKHHSLTVNKSIHTKCKELNNLLKELKFLLTRKGFVLSFNYTIEDGIMQIEVISKGGKSLPLADIINLTKSLPVGISIHRKSISFTDSMMI